LHDPGKILLDVAVALGGDCLTDVAMVRAEPAVFKPVASDPMVSRLISKLASGGHRVLPALPTARAEVRERVWRLAGDATPDAGGQVTVDIDGVLVLAHSEKQDATAMVAARTAAILGTRRPRRNGIQRGNTSPQRATRPIAANAKTSERTDRKTTYVRSPSPRPSPDAAGSRQMLEGRTAKGTA
jgi:hypothetical protein